MADIANFERADDFNMGEKLSRRLVWRDGENAAKILEKASDVQTDIWLLRLRRPRRG